MKQKIAESMLGAVVSLARLTRDGGHLVMVESGNLCIWDLPNLTMKSKEFISDHIIDIILFQNDKKLLLVTKQKSVSQTQFLCVQIRKVQNGSKRFEFYVPILRIKPVCLTYEEAYIVCLAWEKKVQ